MLASLFPKDIDDAGVIQVLIVGTLAILIVVGIGIGLFATWAKREKARREKDINTALNLRR